MPIQKIFASMLFAVKRGYFSKVNEQQSCFIENREETSVIKTRDVTPQRLCHVAHSKFVTSDKAILS